MRDYGRITLISRDSHIKDNWFEWICQRVEPSGTISNGYVQADGYGEMISPETFEKDDE